MSPTSPTADDRASNLAALLVTLLAAVGLLFGAGATAVVASITSTAAETGVEMAGAGEAVVASQRTQARHRRTRAGRHPRERPPVRQRCRALPALAPLVAALRCTPRRGPPLHVARARQ